MNNPLVAILFLVVLTILEGFFVAAEIALVSIRRSRVEQLVEEGRPGARRVRRLLNDPGRFLAVSQLGLTVIGFLASAFAAVSLADGLAETLASGGMDRGHRQLRRPRRRHRDPGPVHDRVRGARPEVARPRQQRAVRAHAVGPAGLPRPAARAARRRPDGDHALDRAAVRRRGDVRGPDHRRGAAADRGARRGAGHPRGRGGADDQRGHRARRPAPARGDGAADRDRRRSRRRPRSTTPSTP